MSRSRGAKRVKCDVAKITASLHQIGDRAVAGIYDVMMDEGEKIAELARSFAPVDEGNLEDAIKVQGQGGGRGALGRFLRKNVHIYVDEGVAVGGGRHVGDYALRMHELLDLPGQPGSGFYRLGPRSQAKAAAGNAVGGKYFERALDERLETLLSRVRNIIKRVAQ